jgi:probable H4MPT-linked C1 transfer pathway protein
LVDVIGYDVGGANTKAAYIRVRDGKCFNARVAVEYFPVWKHPEELANVLLKLKHQLCECKLDSIGVTMTAELSDAYQTKREGVNHILGCFMQAFADVPINVLNTEGKLEPIEVNPSEPLGVAAANWAATGWLVARQLKNCVIVDVGSTSTSIIPIVEGQVVARGKTDLDKLLCGELVYTGSLRTNVAAIVQSIPIRNGVASVSSELFALSADIHRILGNIAVEDYTCETADGRGKTLAEARARLARVVCADTEMLTQQEIINMAKFICDRQIRQIIEGLTKVYSYTKSLVSIEVPLVVTGLGKNFLAAKAAKKMGIDAIVDLGTLLPKEAVLATPAFGVAQMTAGKLGEQIK